MLTYLDFLFPPKREVKGKKNYEGREKGTWGPGDRKFFIRGTPDHKVRGSYVPLRYSKPADGRLLPPALLSRRDPFPMLHAKGKASW